MLNSFRQGKMPFEKSRVIPSFPPWPQTHLGKAAPSWRTRAIGARSRLLHRYIHRIFEGCDVSVFVTTNRPIGCICLNRPIGCICCICLNRRPADSSQEPESSDYSDARIDVTALQYHNCEDPAAAHTFPVTLSEYVCKYSGYTFGIFFANI